MSNYRFELVTRTEAQTGAPILCLHVFISNNSNQEIGDAFIPLDEIRRAFKEKMQTALEESKHMPLTTRPPATAIQPPPAFITVGRTVHYTAYNGTCLAAIVTAVDTEAENVDLAVFTSLPNVAGNKNGGVQFHFGVVGPSPDGQNQSGTWHWPERV